MGYSNSMHIKIQKGSNRRLAYTDRKEGYFQYLAGMANSENGYHRGNVQFFKEFTCQGHKLEDADFIRVYPEGFRAVFDKYSLDVSLLIDEQAFYVSSDKNIGILGIWPVVQSEITAKKTDSDDETEAEDFWANKKIYETQKIKEWRTDKIDGINVLFSETGIAIAGDFNFYHAEKNEDIELIVSDGKHLSISDRPFANSGWYVVFEESKEAACEKAVRLAKTKAIEAHKKLLQNFFEKCSFDCGDKKFNEALQWARFSAWLLATKDHGSNYRGIWAGLPWFRDNWGRDTFISLCGTLIISGCFDEAKDVLLGFAGFQDIRVSSPSYGRIPNRYRDENDVIYNTADGTLWFIRALWEYVQYSGDKTILEKLRDTVELALDSDINRCDGNGFLIHGDADTWMDARIAGEQTLSPRGSRANDIQALWFTALKIGSYIENLFSNKEKSEQYNKMADRVKKSFEKLFWNEDCNALADSLPEGGYGEWAKNMQVRPNQLFAITVPSILLLKEKDYFISKKIGDKVIANVNRELVNPFGLYSLSPEDPLFHPEHENPEWYHKDAAYHNGTIWEWNSGAYISACAIASNGVLPDAPSAILQNEAKMILERGCAGSLSENIHARPDENGNPKLSGTFSQAWSVAEFVRNVVQDFTGFKPRLVEKKIEFKPCLPSGCSELKACMPFGKEWIFSVDIKRSGKNYKSKVEWKVPLEQTHDFALSICDVLIEPNTVYEISTPALNGNRKAKKVEKFGVPAKWNYEPFETQNLDNDFCGSEHKENYLFNLIYSGRMQSKTSGGPNTAALEWYFDSEDFKQKYFTNIELGAIYTEKKTTFRLWSPTAKKVTLLLYKNGTTGEAYKEIPMGLRCDANSSGVWEISEKGNLDGVYYLFKVQVYGVEQLSADPYAKACGANGKRSMVVDLKRTNPAGWDKVSAPVVKSPSDVIAYEAHVADITSSPDWNGPAKLKRTFLGAATTGTSLNGNPTGFDYIKSLGVTHVQFLPVFDFRSVDEEHVNDDDVKNRITFGSFNWGYDPENYACLEGSYSTNPCDGAVRIKEFKQMVKAYNDAGIGVIMDVVYNHVNDGLHQALGTSVPGYFFRVEGYSGAGEDTASERIMFRKYMIDTLSFWLKEYKLSGFRFDLMGLHDVETMNAIRNALVKIKKDVLIYGEGWDMYRSFKMVSACQSNSDKMPDIGFFNDAIRCGIKGPISDDKQKGFIHDGSRKESVKFGIVGATEHEQVDYAKVEGTACPKPWSRKTWVSVNYTEIHDNMTCYDKLFMVEQNKPEEYRDQLQKMAIALVLLSQGYPILHAGMEFCRTKEIPQEILAKNPVIYDVARSDDGKRAFCRNTYNVCDRINMLDWSRSVQKKDVVEYVKNLIAMRKAHPAFRLTTGSQCNDLLKFIDNKKAKLTESVLAWELDGAKCGDSWKKILIVANPEESEVSVALDGDGDWRLISDGVKFYKKEEVQIIGNGSTVSVKPKTVTIYALS